MTTAEKALFEAVMHNPEIWYSLRFRERHLSTGQAALVYAAIRAAIRDGLKVITPQDLLTYHIPPSLAADFAPWTSANWRRHEENAIDEAGRRELQKLPAYILDVLAEKTASQAVSSVLARLSEYFSDDGAGGDYCKLGDAMDMDKYAQRAKMADAGKLPGLATGYHGLDKYLHGLQDGSLYYIGARPSGGKSALLADLAMNVVVEEPIGFMSIESGRGEIADRILSREARVDMDHIAVGTFNASDLHRISEKVDYLRGLGFYIYDRANADIEAVVTGAAMLKQKFGVKALFIDYLQNIDAPGDWFAKPEHVQIAHNSKRLKQLARDLNIPVVVGAQLRREVEGKTGLPKLSDFQGSSQIEKDADAAILLHEIDPASGEMRWLIQKNRHGAKGDVSVIFDKAHMRFTEIGKPDFA